MATKQKAGAVVSRDGIAVTFSEDENKAARFLLMAQGQSIDWATKYEGWAITAPEPWEQEKARELSGIARALFSRHDHPMSYRDALTRENCGACVLNGYGADPVTGPNYAGWERAAIQAGRAIHKQHVIDALNSENRRYADALARDLATFGWFSA